MESKRPEDPIASERKRIVRSVRSALRAKAASTRLPWRRNAYVRMAQSDRVRLYVSAIHGTTEQGVSPKEVEELATRFSIKAATKRRRRFSTKLKFGDGHRMKIGTDGRGISIDLAMREAQFFYK